MRRLLFTRHFDHYTGGHGKVLDYLRHADAHPAWTPELGLHPDSRREGNPFLEHPRTRVGIPVAGRDDVLFLAGEDWRWMPPDDPDRLVINLIQGVRHADPGSSLRAYLPRRAIRICVSHAVAEEISATGEVCGPVHVIPAALSLPKVAPVPHRLREGIFIAAHKQPELGVALADALRAQGYQVELQLGLVERDEFLAKLARAEVAIPLPLAQEGFFLPGLEAMALGCLLVGVDAAGNREYLRDGVNAIVAAPTLAGILAAVSRLPADRHARNAMIAAGGETAAAFTIAREREAFHALLDGLEAQWNAT